MNGAHDVFVLCQIVNWLWLDWHSAVGMLYRGCCGDYTASCRILLLELEYDLGQLFVRDEVEL